ncbi:glycosyltransferase family 2 protein [Candidatus Gottesmanbacteria bacterium]|nr:glycosyltransferase family 2 protein [Candidatus Gottesmanbacteria bacterium]
MSISAIIITRNEAANIESCIRKLSFAREVIVVDNDSSDLTAQIAKTSKAQVFRIPGVDFSYLRNVGKEKATSEWLFYVDADERPSDGLIAEMQQAIQKTKFSAFEILRQNYFFGKIWGSPERMIRLIRKGALLGWQGSLHETPIVIGKVGSLDSLLLHYTHEKLHSMVEKTNEWSEIEARLRYKNNHPPISWWRFIRVMIVAFWQSFWVNGGWKAGTYGLIEAIYQAYSMFITYAKLWEKQHKSLRHGFISMRS